MYCLVTGTTGLLGSTFLRALGSNAVGLPRDDLSVEKSALLVGTIASYRPNVVINCAAHVNADQAEDDPKPVYEANAELPKRIAHACLAIGVPLVHFSSTGCYGDWKDTPYTEQDPVRPTTVHHTSKVRGEEAIRDVGPEHLILRTGWLFGGQHHHKKNFVWQRLLEASARATLTSDQSQRGCPTLVDDVVAQTSVLLANSVRGTLNCVNGGTASRFEYVSKIVELFHLPCRITAGEAFARRAPVSPNETAINQRMQQLALDRMPHWITSLTRYRDEVVTWPKWHQLAKAKGAL